MGEEVEVMEAYEYLLVHLDNRLDWRCNADDVQKNGQSSLYFLRWLRSLSICSKVLYIFHKSAMESSILSAVVCWGSSIRASDLKKLNKVLKRADSVLLAVLEPLEEIMQRRILYKMKNMIDNPEHPLHNTVIQQQGVFSLRILQIRCNTDATGDPSCSAGTIDNE